MVCTLELESAWCIKVGGYAGVERWSFYSVLWLYLGHVRFYFFFSLNLCKTFYGMQAEFIFVDTSEQNRNFQDYYISVKSSSCKLSMWFKLLLAEAFVVFSTKYLSLEITIVLAPNEYSIWDTIAVEKTSHPEQNSCFKKMQ